MLAAARACAPQLARAHHVCMHCWHGTHAGELGAGSDLLAELAEQERQALWGDAEGAEGDDAGDQQANAEALLLQALEPAAEAAAEDSSAKQGSGEPPIPIEPAVTGKLV